MHTHRCTQYKIHSMDVHSRDHKENLRILVFLGSNFNLPALSIKNWESKFHFANIAKFHASKLLIPLSCKRRWVQGYGAKGEKKILYLNRKKVAYTASVITVFIVIWISLWPFALIFPQFAVGDLLTSGLGFWLQQLLGFIEHLLCASYSALCITWWVL